MSNTVRSQQFEDLFNDWSIPFKLDESADIDSIRRSDDAQVRKVANRALPDNVDAYALQMQAGRQFPPVVVWNGVLIDGNTRLAAAKKTGRALFPVYLVELPSIKMARIVAGALNNIGGQRLSGEEARTSAIDMMDMDFTDAQIAMYLGVTAESARQWRKLQSVDDRANRLGIQDAVAGLKKNQRMELAKITHDEPFRRMVDAITETGPALPDVKEAVKRAVDAASDEQACEIIAAAKQEWTPLGPAPKKHRPNRAAQQARMAIGSLLKLDPADVIDPARQEQDLQRWHDLYSFVKTVIQKMDSAA